MLKKMFQKSTHASQYAFDLVTASHSIFASDFKVSCLLFFFQARNAARIPTFSALKKRRRSALPKLRCVPVYFPKVHLTPKELKTCRISYQALNISNLIILSFSRRCVINPCDLRFSLLSFCSSLRITMLPSCCRERGLFASS